MSTTENNDTKPENDPTLENDQGSESVEEPPNPFDTEDEDTVVYSVRQDLLDSGKEEFTQEQRDAITEPFNEVPEEPKDEAPEESEVPVTEETEDAAPEETKDEAPEESEVPVTEEPADAAPEETKDEAPEESEVIVTEEPEDATPEVKEKFTVSDVPVHHRLFDDEKNEELLANMERFTPRITEDDAPEEPEQVFVDPLLTPVSPLEPTGTPDDEHEETKDDAPKEPTVLPLNKGPHPSFGLMVLMFMGLIALGAYGYDAKQNFDIVKTQALQLSSELSSSEENFLETTQELAASKSELQAMRLVVDATSNELIEYRNIAKDLTHVNLRKEAVIEKLTEEKATLEKQVRRLSYKVRKVQAASLKKDEAAPATSDIDVPKEIVATPPKAE